MPPYPARPQRGDRRLWPASAARAHDALDGQSDLPQTGGEAFALAAPLTDLLTAPQDGRRDRQLVLGEGFVAVDSHAGMVFGFAQKDGFCGWLERAALGPPARQTHVVISRGTHLYGGPKVQSDVLAALPIGARLRCSGQVGDWAETPGGYVPARHLRPLDSPLTDPVAVAESLLGAPYLWGGNSGAGLDCSGLAQIAYGLCGQWIAADSDLQRAAGTPAEGPPRRGDLWFWKGHVALVVDETRLIHANGASMSVGYEPLDACIARTAAAGGGPVTDRRRLLPA